jgi:hypothetical protein
MSGRWFITAVAAALVACAVTVVWLTTQGREAAEQTGAALIDRVPTQEADAPPPADEEFAKEPPEVQALDGRPRRATEAAHAAVRELRSRFGHRWGVTYPDSSTLAKAARRVGVDTKHLVIRRVHPRAFAVCEQRFRRWSCFVHTASTTPPPVDAKQADPPHAQTGNSPTESGDPEHTARTSGQTLDAALQLAKEGAENLLRTAAYMAERAKGARR